MGCLQLPLFDRTRKSRSDMSECQSPETTYFLQDLSFPQARKTRFGPQTEPKHKEFRGLEVRLSAETPETQNEHKHAQSLSAQMMTSES